MSESEHRVLVVGAAGVDIKVQPRTETVELAGSNPGTIRWSWGGVARNMAENLARLGAEVHLITAVGDDGWGHALLHSLRELGINTDAHTVPCTAQTGNCGLPLTIWLSCARLRQGTCVALAVW